MNADPPLAYPFRYRVKGRWRQVHVRSASRASAIDYMRRTYPWAGAIVEVDTGRDVTRQSDEPSLA